ncbi:MAG: glycosyltransferase family 2 protein [Actinomycetota bacterium]|nr:glycosyltransferase family 2 protein [Actinomycetota bacterium]
MTFVRVSVVILAYKAEPWLERSVRAALDSDGVDVEVVLVDNGCTDDGVERLAGVPGVTFLRPEANLGFAGGCNLGARHATGEVLALVNSDAVVEPGALAALAAVALEPDVGIATGSIRLGDDTDRLNSGGNDIHFLGFSWSGHFGELASTMSERLDVLGASGAGMAMRRSLWEQLDGFDDEYFAYHEDAELSLRCWQLGLRVVYVPEAVIVHRYQFTRNPGKHYLIERNRLILVLTLYQRRTLLALAPAFILTELAMLALAVLERWWPQKLASWKWLLTNRRHVLGRRRRLQGQRLVTDRQLASRFAAHLAPGNYSLPAALRPLNWLLATYWRLVSPWI